MIDLESLLEKLTNEDIIDIVIRLGADRYEEKHNCIIFPTICHNLYSEEASMKLYYYFDNKRFVCYTECNKSYNLFELIDQRFQLLGRKRVERHEDKRSKEDYTFYDIILFVLQNSQISVSDSTAAEKYISQVDKYVKSDEPVLKVIDDKVLKIFSNYYPVEWINEHISPATMKKFNILYSIERNSIVIPHYNLNGELIGIRERNLDENKIEEFGKYRPIKIEQTIYKHPLSLNLYGLNIVKNGINKAHKVIIMEGEKSALLGWEYYGENSIVVASCGSHLNKNQIKLLVKNFDINEIIIAYDKEYETYEELSEYSLKMKELCNKYSQYCTFSFVRDKDNLLQLKDSPIDCGKEKFEQLIKGRIRV
jgi:hypothetical protein